MTKKTSNNGCAFILLLIPVAYLIYLGFKPEDAEIQKRADEAERNRIEYLKRFNYKVDSVANTFSLLALFDTSDLVKGKYIILNDNGNGQYYFDANLTRQLPDSIIAYHINDLKTLIIKKDISGEQHFDKGFEVSNDEVRLSFVNLKSNRIITTYNVIGLHQIVSQSRRSHTKKGIVTNNDIITSIIGTIKNR